MPVLETIIRPYWSDAYPDLLPLRPAANWVHTWPIKGQLTPVNSIPAIHWCRPGVVMRVHSRRHTLPVH